MQFHPDFTVSGLVIAVSPRTGGIKLRYTEEGVTREQWYGLSFWAHPRLPKVGRRVELSIGATQAKYVNSWCHLNEPAPEAPYKVEPAAGEDIPFEVSR